MTIVRVTFLTSRPPHCAGETYLLELADALPALAEGALQHRVEIPDQVETVSRARRAEIEALFAEPPAPEPLPELADLAPVPDAVLDPAFAAAGDA